MMIFMIWLMIIFWTVMNMQLILITHIITIMLICLLEAIQITLLKIWRIIFTGILVLIRKLHPIPTTVKMVPVMH